MRVLVIHEGVHSVDYHRLIVPFADIDRNFDDINLFSLNSLEGVTADDLKREQIDIVVFSRNISATLNPRPIFNAIKAAGAKIVIDIDDHWLLPVHHPNATIARKSNLSRCIEDQIFMADAVITTHQELKNEISKIRPSKHVYISANGIDPKEPQMSLEGLKYTSDSVYWQGGSTHLHDLKLLEGAFKGLIDYKLTLGGYYDSDIWREYLKIFNKTNYEYEPITHVDMYAHNYRNKGICVTPLLNNRFNRMKSELKIIEAGWFQKPVISSKVHPYTRIIKEDVNGLFCETKEDWKVKIKGLLSNEQWQNDLRFSLHETVKEKYLINKVNEQRVQCLIDMYAK
jgi:glycosyltransferase involved in cell wall biosynthesis